jgi:hypothetical protein
VCSTIEALLEQCKLKGRAHTIFTVKKVATVSKSNLCALALESSRERENVKFKNSLL